MPRLTLLSFVGGQEPTSWVSSPGNCKTLPAQSLAEGGTSRVLLLCSLKTILVFPTRVLLSQ